MFYIAMLVGKAGRYVFWLVTAQQIEQRVCKKRAVYEC